MATFIRAGQLDAAGRQFVAAGAQFCISMGVFNGFIAGISNASIRQFVCYAYRAEQLQFDKIAQQRNIGISAHIDSGKTTFTERVLYYTGRIKEIHEVRGKDQIGAKMDHMELEREKGITIQSAATFCNWKRSDKRADTAEDFNLNIIDTPGHIDFTIEVERALRVLDGAILIVCAASGVQSQTITVDRQMKRYNVPRVTFINKMDRLGANPWKAIDQLREKLGINAAAIQIPIGAEDGFLGVIDIIKQCAIYNRGLRGTHIVQDNIPEELRGIVQEKRRILIENLADVDDHMAELFLEEKEPSEAEIHQAIRNSTIALKFSPVLMGTALGDKGVQKVLDAVCDYLPSPKEVDIEALDASQAEAVVKLETDPKKSFVGLAFKLEEGRFGQLTYLRVYQGTLKRGGYLYNTRTKKKIKVPRLVRMHSSEMEDITEIGPGEICAMFGVECSSGDTFTDGSCNLVMSSMFVPDPVISLAIKVKGRESTNFSKALSRFQREDPTFKVHLDPESNETIISGMGELHLEVYVERLKREYNVECTTGRPQVAFRETITKQADFSYCHKKQTGGAGQFGKVEGFLEPIEVNVDEKGNRVLSEFVNNITGGSIPAQYIPAIQKGFHEAMSKGFLIEHPIQGVKFTLEDGDFHIVDSSELAFKTATMFAFREAYMKANPVILEPVFTVDVTAPAEFQGVIIGLMNKRKATILDSDIKGDEFVLKCHAPLNNMFSFSTDLRAITQGKGEFAMEFSKYEPVLADTQKMLIQEYQKKQELRNK